MNKFGFKIQNSTFNVTKFFFWKVLICSVLICWKKNEKLSDSQRYPIDKFKRSRKKDPYLSSKANFKFRVSLHKPSELEMKYTDFNNFLDKKRYFPFSNLDKGLRGTVVNQTCHSVSPNV